MTELLCQVVRRRHRRRLVGEAGAGHYRIVPASVVCIGEDNALVLSIRLSISSNLESTYTKYI